MFRIEIVEASDGSTLIIEGRLVSHFAETAKQLITADRRSQMRWRTNRAD